MFCMNCGNKIEENACVCLNCGVLIKKRSTVSKKKTGINTKSLGVVSCILGVISIVFSIMLYFYDISPVGMYTEIYERILYTINYSMTAIMLSFVTLIFSLLGKKNNYTSIALFLSLLSFFFIITEFVVVIIY